VTVATNYLESRIPQPRAWASAYSPVCNSITGAPQRTGSINLTFVRSHKQGLLSSTMAQAFAGLLAMRVPGAPSNVQPPSVSQFFAFFRHRHTQPGGFVLQNPAWRRKRHVQGSFWLARYRVKQHVTGILNA